MIKKINKANLARMNSALTMATEGALHTPHSSDIIISYSSELVIHLVGDAFCFLSILIDWLLQPRIKGLDVLLLALVKKCGAGCLLFSGEGQ